MTLFEVAMILFVISNIFLPSNIRCPVFILIYRSLSNKKNLIKSDSEKLIYNTDNLIYNTVRHCCTAARGRIPA